MNNWLVYKHIAPSGKVYIGITGMTPAQRWVRGHGYKGCPVFYHTILKYGWDNIEHKVLIGNLTQEQAKEVEIQLIAYYKEMGLSLNITDGGDGTVGYAHSEDWKDKCREWMKNRPRTQQEVDRRRETMKKNPYHPSEETKKKIAEAARMQDHSKATQAAILKCSKPVYLVDADGNILCEFTSQRNMAKFFGVSEATINHHVNTDNMARKIYGYIRTKN